MMFPFLFIAFHLLIQLAQAQLPNKNLLAVIPCIRKLFGDEFIEWSVLKEVTVTNGEYLGGFCADLSAEFIIEKLKENYQGKMIRDCLASKGNSNLFETYCDKSDELDSKKPDIKSDVEPETPRYANSEENPSQRNFGKISSEIMFSSYPIMKFIKGVCRSEETMEFEQLQNEKDKTDTVDCLETCADKFMQRVKLIMMGVQPDIIKIVQKETNKIENTIYDNINKITKQQLDEKNAIIAKYKDLEDKIKKNSSVTESTPTLITTIQRTSKTKNIDVVKIKAKEYLDKYGEFYDLVDRGLQGNKDYKSDDNKIGNMDNNLAGVFSIYKDCSTLGCGMGPKTTLLFDTIKGGAEEPSGIKKTLETLAKKAEQMNIRTFVEHRKFYKALLGLPKEPVDNNS